MEGAQTGRFRLPNEYQGGSERQRLAVAARVGAVLGGGGGGDSGYDDGDESVDTLPEDWAERYERERSRNPPEPEPPEEEGPSSEDRSSGSVEGSDDGRLEEDPRSVPVDLGPVVDETAVWEDVTGDGGVLKRVHRAGRVGPRATVGFTVCVKYVVRTTDGGIVDVSANDVWPNKEHRFVVGACEVMPGMDVIARSMERGEQARFRVRSDYAFGDEGSPPRVPAGTAWLVLDVELMGLRRPHRDKLFLRANEALPYVLGRKERGNELFKRGEYRAAVHEYRACVKVIGHVDDPIYAPDLKAPLLAVRGNLAAAHVALRNWKRAIKYASDVLATDPTNEKALFRRAQALRQCPDRLEEARVDLAAAIRVNAKSKQLRDEYASLLAEIKSKRKADKAAYGTIFREQTAIYEAQQPRVFFEIAHRKRLLGRLEMELFCDRAPRACENFRALCAGVKGPPPLSYAKTEFHRVIEGFIVQGGDVTGQRGAGGVSIFGPTFDDENLGEATNRAGLLCMANAGPNSNQSQFFLTLAPCPDLGAKHVVFGRVVAGKAVLKRMEQVDVDANDRPVDALTIVKCGEVRGKDRMVDSSDSE